MIGPRTLGVIIDRGIPRYWYTDSEGIKRWSDTSEPVGPMVGYQSREVA